MPPKGPPPVPHSIKHQIGELIRLNAGARPISSDPPVYEVPIQTIYGRLTLHVAFPDQSQTILTQAPTIQVASLVDHPWLDDDMYFTNYPSINQWNNHSNIGLIVREVVTEWTAAPPMPLQANKQSSNHSNKQSISIPNNQSNNQSNSQSNSPSIKDEWVIVPSESQSSSQSINQSSSQSNQSNNQTNNQSSNESSALMLPIPNSFEWIESMSLTELERICNESNASNNQSNNQPINLSNNQAIKDSIYQSPSVQHIEQVKSGLFDSIDRLALSNIEQSEQYSRLSEKLKEARQQSIDQSTSLQALIDRQQMLLQKYTPRGLITLIDQSINQSETKSQQIQESYLNGDQNEQSINQPARRNVDTHSRFIDAYVKERALLHLRQAKRERAATMID